MRAPLIKLTFILLVAVLLSAVCGFIYFSESKLFLASVVVVTALLAYLRMEYTFYIIGLLTPLLFKSPEFFGTINYSIAELLVLTILFVWALRECRVGNLKFEETPLDKPLIFFFLFTMAAAISPIRHIKLPVGVFDSSSQIYSLKVVLDTLEFSLLYFFVTINFRGEYLKKTVTSLIAGLAIASLVGVYQYFQAVPFEDWFRNTTKVSVIHVVISTFEHHNTFGVYIIMTIPLALFLLVYYRGFYRFALLFLGFLSVLALLSSHSRSAWLGFVMSIIVVSIVKYRRMFFLILILLAVFSVSIIGIAEVRELGYVQRILDARRQFDSRVGCFQKVAELALKNPMGIGVGTFRLMGVCGDYHHAHNLYLQIAVERGLFTLGIFLYLLFVFFKGVITKEQKDVYFERVTWGLTAGVIGVLVYGLFDYSFYCQRIAILFFFIVGIVVKVISSKNRPRRLP